MRIQGAIIGLLLTIIGLAIFVYGINLTESRNPLSGTHYAVIGVFIVMAGLLILGSQLFRKSSIFV